MSAFAKTPIAVAARATRQRIAELLDRMSDADVVELGKMILPEELTAKEVMESVVREPLMFTEEQSEARLTAGLKEIEDGKTVTLEDFLGHIGTLRQSLVQR